MQHDFACISLILNSESKRSLGLLNIGSKIILKWILSN
jgi:hypothetical protein